MELSLCKTLLESPQVNPFTADRVKALRFRHTGLTHYF